MTRQLNPDERRLVNRAEEAIDALVVDGAPPAVIQASRRILDAFKAGRNASSHDVHAVQQHAIALRRVNRYGKGE